MAKQHLFLAALFVAISAVACNPSFIIEHGSNLAVTYIGAGLHYKCQGLKGKNIWSRVKEPETQREGASVSFDIDVREIKATSEVKFTLYDNLILRWTKGGTVATWTYWDGKFNTISASKIVPGSGTHTVTVGMCATKFAIIEDGVYLGTYEMAATTVVPTWHMQCLTQGGKLDIVVSEITEKPGRITGGGASYVY